MHSVLTHVERVGGENFYTFACGSYRLGTNHDIATKIMKWLYIRVDCNLHACFVHKYCLSILYFVDMVSSHFFLFVRIMGLRVCACMLIKQIWCHVIIIYKEIF